ncbi:MAG: DNA mismatch repair endonuclease MutL [Nitrospirota bacterium]
MSAIRRLPPELISQIAAGEVVERPASVVKELVDNAIDAGAGSIEVTLAAGGRELIAVSDDGAGMGPEDARLAFERHATSKLRSLDDLERIATLGFRGEALPSIAAVARVHVTTATAGGGPGLELTVEEGNIREVKAAGRPPGTTIEVTRLFHRTPARRKFLRSSATELAKIQEMLTQQALAYPTIAFRLVHQGRELVRAPSTTSLRARAGQLFGLEWAHSLLAIDGRAGGVALQGLISAPPQSWPHRRFQYWSVNRRPIRSPLLSHALYDGYASLLRRGQHPAALLHVTLDPAHVDVNIHPSKLEVRFAKPQELHALVRDAVSERLNDRALPNVAYGDGGRGEESEHEVRAELTTGAWPAELLARETPAAYAQRAPAPSVSSLLAEPLIEPLGQLYQTYIVAVVDGALQLIDQHAAHERILFEECLAELAKGRLAAQPRLVPQTIALPAEIVTLLAERAPLLAQLGVECEPFGPDAIVVRSTPAILASAPLEPFFSDLAESWLESGAGLDDADGVPQHESNAEARRLMQAVAATIACHGAIKAHQALDRREMAHLLTALHERHVAPTCPHGRPIRVSFTREQLEKLFHRR